MLAQDALHEGVTRYAITRRQLLKVAVKVRVKAKLRIKLSARNLSDPLLHVSTVV